jgi:Asp-tRNA(Asn)/Glu-tRNA(Gln) amidotransferase A subunit family amidase
MPGDPLSRPLIEIARELRDRRTTARELVDAAIARHESVGERLHAYSFWATRLTRPSPRGSRPAPCRACRSR